VCREVSPSRYSVGESGHTFLHPYLCSTRLWPLFRRRLLSLLHAPNLFLVVSPPNVKTQETLTLIMVGRRSCRSCGSKVCFRVRVRGRGHMPVARI
jgi:hypothetical protein